MAESPDRGDENVDDAVVCVVPAPPLPPRPTGKRVHLASPARARARAAVSTSALAPAAGSCGERATRTVKRLPWRAERPDHWAARLLPALRHCAAASRSPLYSPPEAQPLRALVGAPAFCRGGGERAARREAAAVESSSRATIGFLKWRARGRGCRRSASAAARGRRFSRSGDAPRAASEELASRSSAPSAAGMPCPSLACRRPGAADPPPSRRPTSAHEEWRAHGARPLRRRRWSTAARAQGRRDQRRPRNAAEPKRVRTTVRTSALMATSRRGAPCARSSGKSRLTDLHQFALRSARRGDGGAEAAPLIEESVACKGAGACVRGEPREHAPPQARGAKRPARRAPSTSTRASRRSRSACAHGARQRDERRRRRLRAPRARRRRRRRRRALARLGPSRRGAGGRRAMRLRLDAAAGARREARTGEGRGAGGARAAALEQLAAVDSPAEARCSMSRWRQFRVADDLVEARGGDDPEGVRGSDRRDEGGRRRRAARRGESASATGCRRWCATRSAAASNARSGRRRAREERGAARVDEGGGGDGGGGGDACSLATSSSRTACGDGGGEGGGGAARGGRAARGATRRGAGRRDRRGREEGRRGAPAARGRPRGGGGGAAAALDEAEAANKSAGEREESLARARVDLARAPGGARRRGARERRAVRRSEADRGRGGASGSRTCARRRAAGAGAEGGAARAASEAVGEGLRILGRTFEEHWPEQWLS